jgi:quinol monooxygenase YgiN
MILRTVHMHFRPEAVPEFMALFETHREAIAAQPGCRGVHLIQSPDSPERLGTVSIWDSASDLDAYRHSALFGAVWPATKALFASSPSAESHQLLWSS